MNEKHYIKKLLYKDSEEFGDQIDNNIEDIKKELTEQGKKNINVSVINTNAVYATSAVFYFVALKATFDN